MNESTLKSIVNEIRDNYFVFLSSLKYENIADKKNAKDYKNAIRN